MQQKPSATTENGGAVENPAVQRQRIQMVLLRESGMTQPAIAAVMGVWLSTVNRAQMAFDQGGIKALKPKPSGGRQRENIAGGRKGLAGALCKAAGAGEMLNIHDLKATYEQAIRHPTSNSTIYNLLARHGWRKLMPRPFHPLRDLAARNDLETGFPRAVRRARLAAARRGRRLRIMFADEARFGRINRRGGEGADRRRTQRSASSSFANTSICTEQSAQEGREALALSDHANIEHGVLPELSQRSAPKVCQAGYPLGSRRCPQPSLRRPRGPRQRLAPVPAAYAPELNPKENIWDEIH